MQVLLTNIKNYSVDIYGALAHLARALPWHGRGDRFESDMLHQQNNSKLGVILFVSWCAPTRVFCFASFCFVSHTPNP